MQSSCFLAPGSYCQVRDTGLRSVNQELFFDQLNERSLIVVHSSPNLNPDKTGGLAADPRATPKQGPREESKGSGVWS